MNRLHQFQPKIVAGAVFDKLLQAREFACNGNENPFLGFSLSGERVFIKSPLYNYVRIEYNNKLGLYSKMFGMYVCVLLSGLFNGEYF